MKSIGSKVVLQRSSIHFGNVESNTGSSHKLPEIREPIEVSPSNTVLQPWIVRSNKTLRCALLDRSVSRVQLEHQLDNPVTIILTVATKDASGKQLNFTETSVELRNLPIPQFQALHTRIRDIFPHLTEPYKYILYWRLNNDTFLPIYDLFSYNTAMALMVVHTIYLVEKCNTHQWTVAMHPMSIHKGRDSDIELLRGSTRAPERSRKNNGLALGDSANMRLATNILKGIPLYTEEVTDAKKSKSKASKTSKKSSKLRSNK